MTAAIIPIRQQQPPPREPCAALAAVILAERSANMLRLSDAPGCQWRAEIISAAAAGDTRRVLEALEGWIA